MEDESYCTNENNPKLDIKLVHSLKTTYRVITCSGRFINHPFALKVLHKICKLISPKDNLPDGDHWSYQFKTFNKGTLDETTYCLEGGSGRAEYEYNFTCFVKWYCIHCHKRMEIFTTGHEFNCNCKKQVNRIF